MMEKNKSDKMTNSAKPVPMKLFAAWEVDRTPSNCIPRYVGVKAVKASVAAKLNGVEVSFNLSSECFRTLKLEQDFDCLYNDKAYDINEIFPQLKKKIFDIASKRTSSRDKYLQQVIALQNETEETGHIA